MRFEGISEQRVREIAKKTYQAFTRTSIETHQILQELNRQNENWVNKYLVSHTNIS